jgi:hypothetical protein
MTFKRISKFGALLVVVVLASVTSSYAQPLPYTPRCGHCLSGYYLNFDGICNPTLSTLVEWELKQREDDIDVESKDEPSNEDSGHGVTSPE